MSQARDEIARGFIETGRIDNLARDALVLARNAETSLQAQVAPRLNKVETDTALAAAQADRLGALTATLQTEIARLKAAATARDAREQDVVEALSASLGHYEELEKSAAALQQQVLTLQRETTVLKDASKTAAGEMQRVLSTQSGFHDDFSALRSSVGTLKQAYEDHTSDLQPKLAASTALLQGLTQELSELQASSATTAEGLKSKASIKELNDLSNGISLQIKVVQDAITTLSSSAQSQLSSVAATVDARIATLHAQLLQHVSLLNTTLYAELQKVVSELNTRQESTHKLAHNGLSLLAESHTELNSTLTTRFATVSHALTANMTSLSEQLVEALTALRTEMEETSAGSTRNTARLRAELLRELLQVNMTAITGIDALERDLAATVRDADKVNITLLMKISQINRTLTSELEQLKETMARDSSSLASSLLADFAVINAGLQSVKSNSSADVASLNAAIAKAYDAAISRVNELNASFSAREETLVNALELVWQQLEQQNTSATESSEGFSKALEELRATVASFQALISAQTAAAEKAALEQKDAHANKETMAATVVESITSNVRSIEQRVDTVLDSHASLDRRLIDISHLLDTLTHSAGAIDAVVASVNSLNMTLLTRIQEGEARQAALAETLVTATRQFTEHVAAMNATLLEHLSSVNNTLTNRVETVNTTLAERIAALAGLTATANAGEAGAAAAAAATGHLEARLAALEANLESLRNKPAEAASSQDTGAAEQKLASLEVTVQSLQTVLEEVKRNAAAAAAEAASATGTAVAPQADTSAIEQELASLRNEIQDQTNKWKQLADSGREGSGNAEAVNAVSQRLSLLWIALGLSEGTAVPDLAWLTQLDKDALRSLIATFKATLRSAQDPLLPSVLGQTVSTGPARNTPSSTVSRHIWPDGKRVDGIAELSSPQDAAAADLEADAIGRFALLSDVRSLIDRALALYAADATYLRDFALAQAGALVVETAGFTSTTWKPSLGEEGSDEEHASHSTHGSNHSSARFSLHSRSPYFALEVRSCLFLVTVHASSAPVHSAHSLLLIHIYLSAA